MWTCDRENAIAKPQPPEKPADRSRKQTRGRDMTALYKFRVDCFLSINHHRITINGRTPQCGMNSNGAFHRNDKFTLPQPTRPHSTLVAYLSVLFHVTESAFMKKTREADLQFFLTFF